MESGAGKPKQSPLKSVGAPKTTPTCPACGTVARRAGARYCSTCGRSLEGNYLPADALRASYHLHRRASSRGRIKSPRKVVPMSSFPTPNRNGASQAALAFATYALVPYLGILFCPGAVLMGGIGLFYSFHSPQKGGRRAACAGIALGLLILCAQLLLWWIIAKVPEWTMGL